MFATKSTEKIKQEKGTISIHGAFFVDPFHEISWNPHAQVGLSKSALRQDYEGLALCHEEAHWHFL